VAESTPQRGLIVLISDLLADREPLFRGIEMLKHRRHDVLVFHILDDDEVNFPFSGTTRFEGMEELPHLCATPRRCATATLKRSKNTWSKSAAAVRGAVSITRWCAPAIISTAALARFLNFRLAAMKSGGRAVTQG